MAKPLVTQERLRELLSYDPETGVFTRLKGVPSVKAGSVFGCVNGKGYLVGMIDRRIYLLHRLAWFYANGNWPTEIDHINLVKSDNRIENLRAATRSQNECNKAPANKSGFKGVSWQPHARKFKASINVGGKVRHLGYADTAAEAHQLYAAAATRHFGKFARLS